MLLGNWVSMRVSEFSSNPKIIIPFTFSQLNTVFVKNQLFLQQTTRSNN
jgi:hypothetical protein